MFLLSIPYLFILSLNAFAVLIVPLKHFLKDYDDRLIAYSQLILNNLTMYLMNKVIELGFRVKHMEMHSDFSDIKLMFMQLFSLDHMILLRMIFINHYKDNIIIFIFFIINSIY